MSRNEQEIADLYQNFRRCHRTYESSISSPRKQLPLDTLQEERRNIETIFGSKLFVFDTVSNSMNILFLVGESKLLTECIALYPVQSTVCLTVYWVFNTFLIALTIRGMLCKDNRYKLETSLGYSLVLVVIQAFLIITAICYLYCEENPFQHK